MNLANLVFFKYSDFLWRVFLDFNSIFGNQVNVIASSENNFGIVLPLAISFYTFQIIGFHVDEYRGNNKEKISLFDFSFFVIFFPQLIAGPIMRLKEFFIQLQKKKSSSSKSIDIALTLILIGVVKKVIIADSISSLIDPVFSDPQSFSWKSLFASIYGFSIQIYCDFSGYTDIARGVALSFGYKIPRNFKAPYFSLSIREFWTRWHITLSKWLRDYLYIPLGGNRISELRTSVNLFVTMLVGGIWHGANYTFLLWGFLHSVFLVFERIFFLKKDHEFSFLQKFFRIVIVFHLITVAWVFFRSDTIEKSFLIFQGLFGQTGNQIDISKIFLLFFVFLFLHTLEQKPKILLFFQKRKKFYLPALGFIVIVIAVTISSKGQSFIYFQF